MTLTTLISPPGVDHADAPPVLQVQNLHTYYGQIHALQGLSLEVREGEIVCLIGGNGAGKTTTLKTISGILHPRQGEVFLTGSRIDRLPPHRIVQLGISQAPEGRKVFARMSVDENLRLGAFSRSDKDGIAKDRERVLALFPRLAQRIRQASGTLSGGEQQMLAIGRALMARPSAPPRRAKPRPRPDAGRDDFRHVPRYQPAGHVCIAGGAERPHGPRRRPPGLRARDRPHRRQRHCRASPRQPRNPTRLSGDRVSVLLPLPLEEGWGEGRRPVLTPSPR